MPRVGGALLFLGGRRDRTSPNVTKAELAPSSVRLTAMQVRIAGARISADLTFSCNADI